jgi:uncharacterized protein YndB with AHSA1/START domain
MSEHSVTHATFVLERTYAAAPPRVFAAWADPVAKAEWMSGSSASLHTLDFRVGGAEHISASGPNGAQYTYDAVIHDIVPDERIVVTEVMHKDGTRIAVTMATVELSAAEEGTRLLLTEQGAYFDGLDRPDWRETGIGQQLDALGLFLAPATADV